MATISKSFTAKGVSEVLSLQAPQNVALAPVLIVMENGVAATRKLTVDYVWIQQNR